MRYLLYTILKTISNARPRLRPRCGEVSLLSVSVTSLNSFLITRAVRAYNFTDAFALLDVC